MSNKEIITKNYILEKLREIMNDPEISVRDRLAALKMAGDSLKMFNSKMVDINIRGLIAQLSSKQLEEFRNEKRIGSPIEVEVCADDSPPLLESGSDGF